MAILFLLQEVMFTSIFRKLALWLITSGIRGRIIRWNSARLCAKTMHHAWPLNLASSTVEPVNASMQMTAYCKPVQTMSLILAMEHTMTWICISSTNSMPVYER